MSNKIEEMERAQQYALDCTLLLFAPSMLQALVQRIPTPPFAFQDRYDIESLLETVVKLKTTEMLAQFIEREATMDDAMVIAWSMHSVIQQINECKRNNGETFFGRYKDLLSVPSAWQVCLFGLQGLRAFWRG